MESGPAPVSLADDLSRALCLVEEVICVGSLLAKQQQQCATQAERFASLERKASAFEEELASVKDHPREPSDLDGQLKEISTEMFQLRAEIQAACAELEKYKQRMENADAVLSELLNQVQLGDLRTVEEKRRAQAIMSEFRHQVAQLRALTRPLEATPSDCKHQ